MKLISLMCPLTHDAINVMALYRILRQICETLSCMKERIKHGLGIYEVWASNLESGEGGS